jgi:hypothetical protein
MAHAQKPDFVFWRNGRVHLNRRGASVQSTTGRRAVHISLQGLYCSCKPVFCSYVTLTGYPLHSLVSHSHLLPCVTVCHHISIGLYYKNPLQNSDEWCDAVGLPLCCIAEIIKQIFIKLRVWFLHSNLSFEQIPYLPLVQHVTTSLQFGWGYTRIIVSCPIQAQCQLNMLKWIIAASLKLRIAA